MLKQKVAETIRKHNLIQKNDRIVVGVSGGPDSVTLLYVLNSLKKELRLTLHVAHLDHMFRPDSDKDRRFVEALAAKLKLPVTVARINIKEIAKKGSLEEIARNARLGFLFGVAKSTKSDKVALGHNLDDQAETVLMRIIRGSGLYGLAGILPKREIAGYQVIRPLIETHRREINAFLKRKRITARSDPSNAEEIYFRNRIRNKLLPLLEKKYNKNITEVLSNLAESAGYDYDYLYRAAQKAAGITGVRLKLNKLFVLHPAIRRLTYRLSISRVKGDLRRITFQHIREIDDLIFHRPTNSIVDLPKGISAAKKRNTLVFYRR
jgi:tRNA(Ile)-lysidine synthase